jgi:hypothetical protein
MCGDGGASLHSSHRQLKQWAREINVVQPPMDAQKPLKWSNTPVIFDIEDHPDRTTAVGCLPLLVSPTIRNLKVVQSERKFAEPAKDETVQRSERAHGTFFRSFSLPASVDASKVAAQYENGVLTVTLPKRDEAKPRTIQVTVK